MGDTHPARIAVGRTAYPGGASVGGAAIKVLVGGHVAPGSAGIRVAHRVLDVLEWMSWSGTPASSRLAS
jgi:hypothetical protein